MNIQHKTEESKGSFYLEQDGELLAEMTYSMAGDGLMIIDHTHVDDKLRGQSAGKKMLNEAVAFARKENLKVLPLCPFAAAMFKKTTEIHDVLK